MDSASKKEEQPMEAQQELTNDKLNTYRALSRALNCLKMQRFPIGVAFAAAALALSLNAVVRADDLTPSSSFRKLSTNLRGLTFDGKNGKFRTDGNDALLNRWKDRLGRPGGGYLFLKHIRKAGGTSLRQYLTDAIRYHRAIREEATPRRSGSESMGDDGVDTGNVSYFEQEFYSMDRRCPEIDARWADTLSVIALRRPIERHLSEFFYSGPGSRGELARLHRARDYDSEEFVRRIRESLPAWIEEGIARNRRDGSLKRHFADNFQTRALSGRTEEMPRPYSGGPQHECSQRELVNGTLERNDELYLCEGGCDAPCIYGGAGGHWQRGTSAGHKITEEEQMAAMKVLESFDVVLLTETFEDEEQAAFVADVMGVPLANASLAGTHKKAKVNANSTIGERYHFYQDILHRAAPELLELLRHHSRFEMELYRHAVQINGRLNKRWREEREKSLT